MTIVNKSETGTPEIKIAKRAIFCYDLLIRDKIMEFDKNFPKILLELLTVVLFIFGINLYQNQPYFSEIKEPKEVKVEEVIDGDTIRVKDIDSNEVFRVRYLGVDTPELDGLDYESCFGLQAKERNEELVLDQNLILEFDKDKYDQFGRTLAYIYTLDVLGEKDVFINLKLLEEGYGRFYIDKQNTLFQDELVEASNIKNKLNRKNVIYSLTTISNILKNHNGTENGLVLFVGIDINGHEVKYVFVPPNPVVDFYYQCSKRFEVDSCVNLFEDKKTKYVIFIDGDECLIYQFNGQFKRVKAINANLIKRQGRGGQSQHRFERLAEISRDDYITRVVDYINEIIQVEQYAYVFGSREIKEMLLRNKKLKPRLQTEDLYHSFNNQTIHDNYFSQLMTIETNDDNKINEIVDLINKGMAEYLLFTLEEINQSINDVDYILIIDNQIDKE